MTAAEGMATVLGEHLFLRSDWPNLKSRCTCGHRYDNPNASEGYSHPQHVADALAAAGYGDVREADDAVEFANSLEESAQHHAAIWEERAEKAEARVTAAEAAMDRELDGESRLSGVRSLLGEIRHFKERAETAEAKTADVLADLKALADRWLRAREPDGGLSIAPVVAMAVELRARIAKHETEGQS